MADIILEYNVDASNIQNAGNASSETRNALKRLGIDSAVIRRIGICMYEGEINMVIHADGGTIKVIIGMEDVTMILADKGPGIPDIELAMKEGYSTADSEAKKIGFGAGMGLPNMKKNADSIQINTEVGVGTTIIMVVRL